MASLKAAQDNNIVLPLTHPSGGPKAYRLEIDEFLADNAMTNLFLLALEAMQKHSIKKPGSNDANWWSFYSLAGIHGAPREDWAEVEKRTMGGGYCHHGMSTFPTWHRPYIFQFEQAVYNQMQIIADEFEDEVKHKYLDALSRFRLPYWDLCMPRHSDKNLAPEKIQRAGGWRWGFPAILKAESVHVRRPKTPNKLEPIDNPLYQFKFPENAEYTGVKPTRPKINWERTLIKWVMRRTPDNKIVRKPDDTPIFDPVDGKTDVTIRTPTKANKGNSDYAKLETKIQQQTQVMATNIWHMLNPEELGEDPITEKPIPTMKINQLRSWDDFASHAIQDPRFKGLTVQSIESWHDSIHNLIGTGDGYNGQMADTSVAAFDPVFWLHHNNIDRLFAIYQALYPDKYVTPGKHAEQNPPLNGDDPILYADDQLYPFKKNSDECYTSADIRDWKNTGFAVPGDQELTPEGVKKVEQYLRDTYYWATDAAQPPNTLHWPKDLSHVEALHGEKASPGPAPALKIEAISLEANKPQLVARALPLGVGAKPQDHAIDAKIGAEALKKAEQAFPEGALIDVEKKEVPTKMRTWNAHIRIKKYAYDGSFNLHFFIGWVKDDQPERFMTKMNEVGFTGIFASPERANCANCKINRDAGIIYADVVPLTSKLTDYLDSREGSENLIRDGVKKTIRNLEAEEVVPFLKEHLQWRITDTKSNLLGGIEESGLEVVVMDRLFEPPHGDNLLGTYGPSTAHPEITAGKPGGYRGDA